MTELPFLSVARCDGRVQISEHKQAYDSLLLRPQSFCRQTPLFVALVGQHISHAVHGQARLCIDPRERRSEIPLVLIDCELHLCVPEEQNPATLSCAEGPRRLPWLKVAPRHYRSWRKLLAQRIYGQVLSPFVSVFCLFASDFGGLNGISKFLAEQAYMCAAVDLPPSALPRLLVVFETAQPGEDRQDLGQKLLSAVIPVMLQLGCASDEEATKIWYARFNNGPKTIIVNKSDTKKNQLKEIDAKIRLHLELSRRAKASEKVLFARDHVHALLSNALEHFITGSQGPFQLIQASRAGNRPSEEFYTHLLELFAKTAHDPQLWRLVPRLVASALILDSLPPGMHFFAACTIFRELYHASCFAAISKHTPYNAAQSRFLNETESEFEVLYFTVASTPQILTAAESHVLVLKDLEQEQLGTFRSNKTCLCCLMRMPDKVLTCNHALCDLCIRIFGDRSRSQRSSFVLSRCVLCGLTNNSPAFQFLPPTAGPRILSLDGGGVKGVIPLVMLAAVEESFIDLGCPLRDYFDLVCGTSSGGLTVLGIFLLQCTTGECLQLFRDLARMIFTPRTSGSLLFARAQRYLISFLADSRYETAAIEEAFNKVFGPRTRKLFNPVSNDTKVAVTATTAHEARPCLLSNYNGGYRPRETSYTILRADDPECDPSIAEAYEPTELLHNAANSEGSARCTSAAPWYFTPKSLPGLGDFQDGGLRNNNPTTVAWLESKFLYRADPDFVLSLGTGISRTMNDAASCPPVKDRSWLRLFRSFMFSMDGQDAWKQLFETIPTALRPRFHRLNITLDGPHPSIDDISIIDFLIEEAGKQTRTNVQKREICDSIYASMFYFELEELPVFTNQRYECMGNIYCRQNLPPNGRQILHSRLVEAAAVFEYDDNILPCVRDFCETYPPFKREIRFSLDSLDDTVNISLSKITLRSQSISGLPEKLRNIIAAQALDAPFGRRDHGLREKPLPPLPKNKRKVSFLN